MGIRTVATPYGEENITLNLSDEELTEMHSLSNKELLLYKEEKKKQLKTDYDNSKINLKFYYQDEEIIFLNNGLEDAITELQRRITANNTIGTNFTIDLMLILLNSALDTRHQIRSNVKTCQDEIDKLENIKDIENYIPSIQYKFDEIINVENYLK